MTHEPVPEGEAKPRTYLANDPDRVTELLLQNTTWVTGEKISDLQLDHAENIVNWMDGQVTHILNMLGVDTDALTAPAMVHWLHQQPVMKAIDAHIVHQKRLQERQAPPTINPHGTWLEKPIAALDIETTGVDIENDRMVSFSLGVAEEPGDWKSVARIVNAGVEIPEGASRIHGITTERAKEEGMPEKDVIISLAKALGDFRDSGIPVCLHNARFDLTILDRTHRRFFGEGLGIGQVLDSMVIDKMIDTYRRGKRTLDAACTHYGVGELSSHSADEDAMRSLRLVWRELTSPKAYEFFKGKLPTPHDLHITQQKAYAEQVEHMASWRSKTGQETSGRDTSWPVASLPGAEVDRLPPWN